MKILTIILALALCALPAMAQRGHSHRHVNYHGHDNHGAQNQGNRDHAFGRDFHHHIDRAHDIRIIGGHDQIFFGGVWFGCGYYDWPLWVYSDDVVVVEIGPQVYEMYSYSNPNLEISVFVEE